MSQEELIEKVQHIIAEKLGVQRSEVTREALFVDDLNADSLDLVELVIALEREFDIEIPDDEAERLSNVQDAIDFINAQTS